MLNTIKMTLLSAAMILAAVLFTPSPAMAAIDCSNPRTPKEAIQCGACGAAGQPACETTADPKSLNETIRSLINILSVIIGIVAVIMIMVAGFRYITSGGASEKVAAAKNTLLYAVIGLIIVALAQIIVRFVLSNVAR